MSAFEPAVFDPAVFDPAVLLPDDLLDRFRERAAVHDRENTFPTTTSPS